MDQQPPKEPRPPINLRIKFRSESIAQFIERYAVDVSRGGIFIRTKEPLAVGTLLKLDFQFQNGSPLMSGDGTVVWIREPDPNRASVPPGMGVRFDKLTPESQSVLEQLLAEKAKRERSGVPGSGTPGAGGMAVRRSSSAFAPLESPLLAKSGAAGAKPTNADAGTASPARGGTAPGAPGAPGMTAASGPAAGSALASSPASAVTASGAGAKPEGAKQEGSSALRPLGTGRGPFAAGAGTPDASAAPAVSHKPSGISPHLAAAIGHPRVTASATSSSAGDVRPRDTTPHSRADAEAAAPFDDIHDEPTQIASRLPSFLADEDEATTVAPLSMAHPVAAAFKPRAPSAPPREHAPPSAESPRGNAPLSSPTESGRTRPSLDEAPPFVGETAKEPRETLKDVPATPATAGGGPGGRPADRLPSHTPMGTRRPSSTVAAVSAAEAAAIDGGGLRADGQTNPGMGASPASLPSPAGDDNREARATAESLAGQPGGSPAPISGRFVAVQPGAAPAAISGRFPAVTGDAKTQVVVPAKRPVPASVIGVSVLVLGAAAFFLFRFFGSQSTETISPRGAPGSGIATVDPGTVGGPVIAPAENANREMGQEIRQEALPPAGQPSSVAGEPVAPAGPAPAAAPAPELPPPAPAPAIAADVAAPGPRGASPSQEKPTERAAPAGQTSGPRIVKSKPNRPSRDTAAGTVKADTKLDDRTDTKSGTKAEAAATAATTKEKSGTSAISPPPAVAAVAPSGAESAPGPGATTAAAAESETTIHQVRITSKPAGADVVLDGQSVGKTPYSVGISDVTAPHSIAVRKEGFEPFEQMISSSSAWTKTKTPKGKPVVQVLKISAKLKQIGGGTADVKPAAESTGLEGEGTTKVEPARQDRPLPPSDDRSPAGDPPP